MSKTKAVLFDLDGTLRDTVGVITKAYEHAVETHNGRKPTWEELAPFIHHHSAVHKGLSSHVEYDLWLTTYREKLGEDWMNAPLYDNCEGVLKSIHTAGYAMAVVTSAEYDRTVEYLQHRRLEGYFQAIAAMRDGMYPKPDPSLVLEALSLLDCRPEDAVMVGDMVVDIAAAHAAGVRCIAVTHGFTTRAELERAGADMVVDSLLEVQHAIYTM